ncbi:hypothetical protein [Roseibium polysiphoniae]|uniref:Caspase domain-containing protein n=1 Tax=Roseibium polysiphoniae TaxID=2571221 RepID=A0ABR9C695_9HYPH|nr:hypothetical protein [Roseibium polysiphoniae]MBD8875411.1 hypothetical protein [Roseibium polysiphoniae]
MVNLDRRMLVVGHWGPEGTTPNNSRVRGIVSRLERVFGPNGNYSFQSMAGEPTGPDVLLNPGAGDISQKLADEADGVTDNTLLFLYYVGHAVGDREDDLRIRLRYRTSEGSPQYLYLSTLLSQVRDNRYQKLILLLDCCHAGRTLKLFKEFPQNSFAMLGTGKGYAYNCDFSDSIISTLERSPSKRDQRIDRIRRGFTYERLFEVARSPFITSTEARQIPQSFPGGLEHELLANAPVKIPSEYNALVPRRTVYGRVYVCLELLSEEPCLSAVFAQTLHRRREFLLEGDEIDGRYISSDRARQYKDFLIESGLAVENSARVEISNLGREALNGRYNDILLETISRSILPDAITYEVLDDIIHSLINDMIPPTPAMISERLLHRGMALELKPSVRIALSLLPSTGRFLKSSSDALFPSEPELAG